MLLYVLIVWQTVIISGTVSNGSSQILEKKSYRGGCNSGNCRKDLLTIPDESVVSSQSIVGISKETQSVAIRQKSYVVSRDLDKCGKTQVVSEK
jgi:hypothetical protein